MKDDYLDTNMDTNLGTDPQYLKENDAEPLAGHIKQPQDAEEFIYTVDSLKSLKLSKITEQFINNNVSHIIFDFCIDFNLENHDKVKYNKLSDRLGCFISYINQIYTIDSSKNITILIRGYWQIIYAAFSSLDTRVNIIARQNTQNIPGNLTFLKKIY